MKNAIFFVLGFLTIALVTLLGSDMYALNGWAYAIVMPVGIGFILYIRFARKEFVLPGGLGVLVGIIALVIWMLH